MNSKYQKLKFDKVKTCSIKKRSSKVRFQDFSRPVTGQDSIKKFIAALPDILIGKEFKEFIGRYRQAVTGKKFILWMLGAHTIKCGLNPIIIDLMKKGYLSHLALNGAGAIHDVEIARWGITSEDVATGLQDGSFGMVKETAQFINEAVSRNMGNNLGYAEILAREIISQKSTNVELSLLATAYRLNIPVSLHPAIGTEIIHQHPSLNGAAFGEKSLLDFQLFTNSVSKLTRGSMVLNVGSAVILPEVFLKALTVVRNLNYPARGFYTAVFDMIRHYRPTVNVMQRPTQDAGKGYYFVGHHEIMIPLLAAAVQ
jgi:hypothetical protein